MTDFELETDHIKKGFCTVCGIDEVGRGALFGPVVAGAVVLDPHHLHSSIDDSKKLSPQKRRAMAEFIYSHARAFSIGWSWNEEIDRINILEATRRAMKMAVLRMQVRPDYALVDGMAPDFLSIPGLKVIAGDRKSMSIAAASIIAKVFRDDLITDLSRFFPHFSLHANKGYPTKKHQDMVSLRGMTIYHRETFRVRWPEKTE